MPSREIFNAKAQTVEAAELSVDSNNEIIATFADGHFVKFPAGLTSQQFEQAILDLEDHSSNQIVITPEYEAAKLAERAASEALIGNTMPAGDQTNVPATPTPAS